MDNRTIDIKRKAGYKNANLHYRFFDNVLIVDNSKHNEVYTNLIQLKREKVVLMTDKLPDYFEKRFPDIYQMLANQV